MPKPTFPGAALAQSALAIALLAGSGAQAAAPPSSSSSASSTSSPSQSELEALAAEVSAAEVAFAKTMADRRLDRFSEFIAEDAVFHGATLRVGRDAIVEKWRPLFEKPQAPFSWAPDLVTVAADGRSALSTGPVRDAQGRVTSRYMTIWRKGADGRWRVAVDQGVDIGPCPPGEAAAR
jgi:ketosteroid isomerase-like protein